MLNYWVGVVSKKHVMMGIEGGFASVCHGKKGPLSRMKEGDYLCYYSPQISLEGGEKYQAFTGVGRILEGEAYQVEMSPTFQPYRLNVEYYQASDVYIQKLKSELEFTQSRSWGIRLRSGLFKISEADFLLITHAMGVDVEKTLLL